MIFTVRTNCADALDGGAVLPRVFAVTLFSSISPYTNHDLIQPLKTL